MVVTPICSNLSLIISACFKSLALESSNKIGTIIPYSQSPLVLRLKQVVELLMQDEDLIVEGNMYEDPEKNGIGGHGDTERKCVGCARIGAAMPMKFGWFYKWKMIGKYRIWVMILEPRYRKGEIHMEEYGKM